jgi:flagellar hook-associated protein FlgK
MTSVLSSTALSGLHAAQRQLQSSAHNVANLQTEGFHRAQVEQQARPALGGVDARVTRSAQAGAALETDVVNRLAAQQSFGANLAVLRAGNRMLGSLLDERA